MKNLLQYCVLLLSLSAFTVTSTLAEIVLDSDGEPVANSGGAYYIMPVLRGPGGGGLELAQTGDETCPLTVVQARHDVFKGIPARIGALHLLLFFSTLDPVGISFITSPELPTCLPSFASWKVEKESQSVKISTNPLPITFPFRIEKADNVAGSTDYKIKYCDPPFDVYNCQYLGISIDNDNNRRLVVNHESPLIVQFVKANRDESAGRMSIINAVA